MGFIAFVVSLFFIYQAYQYASNKVVFIAVVGSLFLLVNVVPVLSNFSSVLVIILGIFSYLFVKTKEIT